MPEAPAVETKEGRVIQQQISGEGDLHLTVLHDETDSAEYIT